MSEALREALERWLAWRAAERERRFCELTEQKDGTK